METHPHCTGKSGVCNSFFEVFLNLVKTQLYFSCMRHEPVVLETSGTMRAMSPRSPRKNPQASPPQQQPTQHFESEAGAVLKRLQTALAEVIGLIPGEVDKAADLERALKIRKTLAWQVFRVAAAANPMLEAANLPGPFAMTRFLSAARSAGVPKAKVEAVSTALGDFKRLVKTHAGNRTTFDSLLSGLTPESMHPANLTHRRAAFRANSHIWGVQVRTRFLTMLLHPTDDRLIDYANIRGVVDLQQLRESQPFILSRTHVEETPGSRLDHPIDAEAYERFGVSLLPEFCTDPDSQVRTYTDGNNELVAELVPSTVGKAGATSAVVASCIKGWGFRYSTPEVPTVASTLIARIEAPFELFVTYVLVAEGAYGDALPTLRANVVGRSLSSGKHELNEALAKHILWHEDVMYLGRGPSVLATPDVPRYPEMVEHVVRRLGWNPACFHVFRCRVEYPPVLSTVVVQFELPERVASPRT